jgi:hypothetical protein
MVYKRVKIDNCAGEYLSEYELHFYYADNGCKCIIVHHYYGGGSVYNSVEEFEEMLDEQDQESLSENNFITVLTRINQEFSKFEEEESL